MVPVRTIPFLAATWLGVDLFEWIRGTDKAFNVPRELLEMSFCVAAAVGVLFWGKRLSAPLAWALCCVVGIGAVLETSQHFVPDWSGERALLSPSNGVAEMLGNADTAVATLAGSGSIPFSLDRDNARGFGNLASEELKEFLSKYRRTVIVLPQNLSVEYLQGVLASNMVIVDVISNGNAQFVLVHRVREARNRLLSESTSHRSGGDRLTSCRGGVVRGAVPVHFTPSAAFAESRIAFVAVAPTRVTPILRTAISRS